MKISKILIILIFLGINLNSYSQKNLNDSLNNNIMTNYVGEDINEEVFNLQTEVSTQKMQRNIFIITFIFMIFVVIMILFIYNTKIKEVLKLVRIQEREIELRKFEVSKLGQILNYTENSISLTNLNGDILWANVGFSNFYGQTYQELVEQKKANIFTNLSETDLIAFEKCKISKLPIFYSFDFEHISKIKIRIKRHLIPLLDENKEIINYAVIDSNLTEK